MKRSVWGFTLIEIMIALVIFVLGVIAIARAFSAGLFAETDAFNTAIALYIAQARLEEIKDTAFAGIADSGPAADLVFTDFSVTVDADEGDNPMEVDVLVNWDTAGGEAGISLTTMVADY